MAKVVECPLLEKFIMCHCPGPTGPLQKPHFLLLRIKKCKKNQPKTKQNTKKKQEKKPKETKTKNKWKVDNCINNKIKLHCPAGHKAWPPEPSCYGEHSNVLHLLTVIFHWAVINTPSAPSRLAPNLPCHRSEVHVCERNSVRSVNPLGCQDFLRSRTDVGVVNPPGIERSNRFQKTLQKEETHSENLQEVIGANRTVHDDNFLHLSAQTHFFQCSSFLADGHNGPDDDLQAAGGADTHADRFPPTWIHVWPIVEWCVVHLHEDVGQDELEREGRVPEWAEETAIRIESSNRRTREAETSIERWQYSE